MQGSADREHVARSLQRRGQSIDLFGGVVEVARRACRRGYTEPGHERPGAVMPGTDRDAFRVEYRGDVMRVHALEREREHGKSFLEVLRSEQSDTIDTRQRVHRMAREFLLPSEQRVVTDRVDVVACGGESDCTCGVRRARLELVRYLRPGRALHGHGIDHVAAALVRR